MKFNKFSTYWRIPFQFHISYILTYENIFFLTLWFFVMSWIRSLHHKLDDDETGSLHHLFINFILKPIYKLKHIYSFYVYNIFYPHVCVCGSFLLCHLTWKCPIKRNILYILLIFLCSVFRFHHAGFIYSVWILPPHARNAIHVSHIPHNIYTHLHIVLILKVIHNWYIGFSLNMLPATHICNPFRFINSISTYVELLANRIVRMKRKTELNFINQISPRCIY